MKAFRTIKECPVIAYPRKRRGAKSYALQITELYVNTQEKEMLGLTFPMTKDKETLDREWNKTVDLVWSYLRDGQDVAFVTEGDPMIYSTYIHLMRLMNEQHPEVGVVSIPGISSVNASASRLGIPMADGDEQIAVVPATEDAAAMTKALLEHDCIVFIKVAKVMDLMLSVLRDTNLIHKASVITKVTSKEELIWRNVEELQGAELEYLTLMVVRK